MYINVAVKIINHVLLKRKVRKISLKTQIPTRLKNKMSTTSQDMFKKKTYVNEDCSKMIESN